MNECVWSWFEACKISNCRKCKDYISVNCDLGEQMLEAFWRDIDEAVKPVREEWARKMGVNDAD